MINRINRDLFIRKEIIEIVDGEFNLENTIKRTNGIFLFTETIEENDTEKEFAYFLKKA